MTVLTLLIAVCVGLVMTVVLAVICVGVGYNQCGSDYMDARVETLDEFGDVASVPLLVFMERLMEREPSPSPGLSFLDLAKVLFLRS